MKLYDWQVVGIQTRKPFIIGYTGARHRAAHEPSQHHKTSPVIRTEEPNIIITDSGRRYELEGESARLKCGDFAALSGRFGR